MTEQRQHAYTTETEEPNPAPETSYAERARTILSLNQVGVLSTQSNKCEGFPFGSTMPYALNDAGQPLFLISAMAMHTKNAIDVFDIFQMISTFIFLQTYRLSSKLAKTYHNSIFIRMELAGYCRKRFNC